MQITVKEAQERIAEVTKHIENVMKIIDLYEASRPSSMAFTKLEEAILWMQVMVAQIPLKQAAPVANEDKHSEEKKADIVDAA